MSSVHQNYYLPCLIDKFFINLLSSYVIHTRPCLCSISNLQLIYIPHQPNFQNHTPALKSSTYFCIHPQPNTSSPPLLDSSLQQQHHHANITRSIFFIHLNNLRWCQSPMLPPTPHCDSECASHADRVELTILNPNFTFNNAKQTPYNLAS